MVIDLEGCRVREARQLLILKVREERGGEIRLHVRGGVMAGSSHVQDGIAASRPGKLYSLLAVVQNSRTKRIVRTTLFRGSG